MDKSLADGEDPVPDRPQKTGLLAGYTVVSDSDAEQRKLNHHAHWVQECSILNSTNNHLSSMLRNSI